MPYLLQKTEEGYEFTGHLTKTEIRHNILICADYTDEELKKALSHAPNGSYISKICRRCGNFVSHPNASTENATFTAQCSNCVGV